MSTTPMESFAVDLATLGPVYPFVGTEKWLVQVALVVWIGFNAELNRLRTPDQVARALKNHAHRDGNGG